MDKTGKFLLPSPKFKKLETSLPTTPPHFLSPQGIQLLPKEQQPPPMYGPRGSTHPPKFLSALKVPSTTNQFDRKQKYFCEPCEAEFHTSTDYKVHKNEHVQCEIDNCTFHGHPAFMETHIGQQHATGLYEQLKKLSTPEEIAQWREERKRNYPTVAIVEQKWKARQQRLLRGEKLGLEKKKRFGRQSDRRPIRGDKSKEKVDNPEAKKRKQNKIKKQRDKAFEKKNFEKAPPPSKDKSTSQELGKDITKRRELQMFKGTSQMVGYKKVKKIETNVLTSLLGMYGSDSEDDSEENSEESDVPEKENETLLKDDSPETHILESDTRVNLEESTTYVLESKPLSEKTDPGKTANPKSSDDEAPEEAPISKTTDIPNKPEPPSKKSKPNSPIGSMTLIAEQPQSSDDEPPEEAPISKTTNIPDIPEPPRKKHKSNSPTLKPHSSSGGGDEAPEEAAISKTINIPDKPQPESLGKKSKPNRPKRPSGLDYRKLRVSRQNTMLEKLLEQDIRHERNVLLQCVRFVVENNFFDKPKPVAD